MTTSCEEFTQKGIYIKDIQPNTEIAGIFVLVNPSASVTKNGGAYWRFTLMDRTGSLDAKMWPQQSAAYPSLPSRQPVKAAGKSELYRETLQLTIEKLDFIDENCQKFLNPEFFIPASERDIDQMWEEFRTMCLEEFKYLPWRRLFNHVFGNRDISEKFKFHPAAVSIHHAWSGGLLEHTLGVAKLCLSIADQYPFLDRQTLLAGAIFHDIGKLREYSAELNINSTSEGNLQGHAYLGLEIIMPHIEKSKLDSSLAEHLKHLILSHHGLPEYGAAKLPQTLEAFILNFADNIDAKLIQGKKIFENEKVSPGDWSNWQKTLERRLFNARQTPAPETRKQQREPECLSLLKE